MVDLLILSLLSWSGVIGWRRGGFRSLIDCASIGSAIAVVIYSLPFVRDEFVDSSWAWEFRKWLQDHMRAVPTGLGLSNSELSAAENLYHMLIVGFGALAVWSGIQMILQVFQTVWKEPSGSVGSRIAGTIIGTCMGGMFAVYMVQCVGLLSWLQGLEVLDLYLGRSFLVWTMMNWIVS